MTRFLLVASVSSLLVLAGCSDLRQAMGLDTPAPDEFSVVDHAPLIMPPDMALRPPRTAAESREEPKPEAEARETVFRMDSAAQAAAQEASSNGLTAGESALLSHAGATAPNADIRTQVDQETAALDKPDTGFAESLLFWKSNAPADESLDANKEAARLKQAGTPTADSSTPAASAPAAAPTIEHTQSNTL